MVTVLCLPSPRRVMAALLALAVAGTVAAAPVLARSDHHHRRHHHSSHHHSSHHHHHGDSDDGGDSGPGDDDPGALPDPGTIPDGPGQTITARLTGYSWQDNTPPGSAIISMPVLHKKAGGTGTYADPITTAVPGSSGSPETPKGTRIYVAKLKRYFIVEDSGASTDSLKHFDLWVGGEGFPKSASDRCMNSYTGSASVVLNPGPGLPVTVGPLTGPNGCQI